MANGWAANEIAIVQTVGASKTNQVVSKSYAITAGGSTHHVVAIDTSNVTVGSGITAKLQTAIGDTWEDSKTVSITGNGRFYIKVNAEVTSDQTYLPLLNQGRIVLTTASGATAKITAINILQEL